MEMSLKEGDEKKEKKKKKEGERLLGVDMLVESEDSGIEEVQSVTIQKRKVAEEAEEDDKIHRKRHQPSLNNDDEEKEQVAEAVDIDGKTDELEVVPESVAVKEEAAQLQQGLAPVKKKTKAKAKAKTVTEGTSVEIGTPELEVDPSATIKKPKRKYTKSTTGGKKKIVTVQASGASTPRETLEREESVEEAALDEASNDEEGENDDKLYCICRTLYDETRMMIACDRCDEWYHTLCMNMTEDQISLVDEFICPLCEPATTQRTTWKEKCLRNECKEAAMLPLSRYCSEECGLLMAAIRLAKIKIGKGGNYQKMAGKYLGMVEIGSARKPEGMAIWMDKRERKAWLESVMGVKLSHFDILDEGKENEMTPRLDEIGEFEELTRLEIRRKQVEEKKYSVNAGLDALAARTKLLQLAEDRVATLEPILDEETGAIAAAKKNSKGRKIKEESGLSSGQPRCGYDERLGWEDGRFQTWSLTDHAKDLLEERIPIDGNLCIDNVLALEQDQVAICGQSKRKCKRHADWSIIRGADMEVERELQTNLLSSLADEESELNKKMMELKRIIKVILMQREKERREVDILLAQQIANEGTRRAKIIPIS